MDKIEKLLEHAVETFQEAQRLNVEGNIKESAEYFGACARILFNIIDAKAVYPQFRIEFDNILKLIMEVELEETYIHALRARVSKYVNNVCDALGLEGPRTKIVAEDVVVEELVKMGIRHGADAQFSNDDGDYADACDSSIKSAQAHLRAMLYEQGFPVDTLKVGVWELHMMQLRAVGELPEDLESALDNLDTVRVKLSVAKSSIEKQDANMAVDAMKVVATYTEKNVRSGKMSSMKFF